jgi:hypothetical protein
LSGTPGSRNSRAEGPVVINEFMALAAGDEDWIELYNTTDEAIDLSGFYVSDDPHDRTRYRLPEGTWIDENDFLVITESECGFGLNSGEETLLLTAPDGQIVWSRYHYSEQRPGISRGRSPDGGEEWSSYRSGSPGDPNPPPSLTGGVVINEIHYHPESENDLEEFIEIYNTAGQTIDLSGWSFQDGLTYSFPFGTRLEDDSYLVIGHDPEAVEAAFGVSGVLGPFETGRLSNRGERIALCDRYGNLVDEVTYADGGEWPPSPDGDGPSLELISPSFDGRIPACWAGSRGAPTPGEFNSVLSDNIPPQIASLIHSPTMPGATDSVVLQARIVDHDGRITSAKVFFKRDQEEEFASLEMTRETPDSDIYRAVLPPQPDGSLVEFFIRAEDDRGTATLRPEGAPGSVSAETGAPVNISYLYIVDELPHLNNLPIYRILMTEDNSTEIDARPLESNVLLSAGLVYENQPFYDLAVRYREQNRWKKGIRIELRGSERLRGERKINLSRYNAVEEHVCGAFYESVGLPVYETRDVRVLINSLDMGFYIDTERIDEDFVQRAFPYDPGGTLVRGGWELIAGEDIEGIAHVWEETLWRYKEPEYPELLEAEIDSGQWIRCLSAMAVSGDWDTLLGGLIGNHMDYLRPSDQRVEILPIDMDEAWRYPWVGIHGGTLSSRPPDPRIEQLLLHPRFQRQYYETITRFIDEEFSPREIFPMIEAICEGAGLPLYREQLLKAFVEERTKYLEQVIEDYVDGCGAFSPRVLTNGGVPFFTDEAEATVSGKVLAGIGQVEALRVDGDPQNLLSNGGFEEGYEGWQIEDLPPYVFASIDNQNAKSGGASIKISIEGDDPDYYGVSQVVDCRPDTKYRLFYFLRAVGMDKGNMYVNIIDADNGEEYLSTYVPAQRQNGPWVWVLKDCNWAARSGIFRTRENTVHLAVRLCRVEIPHYITGEASGTVWFDDLRLEEVGGGRQTLGNVAVDALSGEWTAVIPLELGKNVFEFAGYPVSARDFRSPTTQICIYRSGDTDGDGLADAWEKEHFGSLIWGNRSDPDGDDLSNDAEFLLRTDPASADSDGDTIPDGVEVTNNLDPLQENLRKDSDGDGLLDLVECLKTRTNPLSTDTDGDGLPDGWEVTYSLRPNDPWGNNGSMGDPDCDGLSNMEEKESGLNPQSPDSDGDTMPDGWEVIHQLNPVGPAGPDEDSDSDGMPDREEYKAGTDPRDAESVLRINPLILEKDGVLLTWSCVRGKAYQVLFSDDLTRWKPLTGVIAASSDSLVLSHFDTQGFALPQRFYRVVIPKPGESEVLFSDAFDIYEDTQDAEVLGGWTIVSGSNSAGCWTIRSTDGSLGNLDGSTGPPTTNADPAVDAMQWHYFISSSDLAGEQVILDEVLASPEIDCTGFSDVRLRFMSHTRSYVESEYDQRYHVDVRTCESGASDWTAWKTVFERVGKGASQEHEAGEVLLNVGLLADGRKLQVRWRFHVSCYDWWWAIDAVRIEGRAPEESE